MPQRIFINYRRDDEPGFVGRIFDRLASRFPAGQTFIDVEGIPAGADFAEVLQATIGRSDVFLAMIGRRWLDCEDEQGRRRLDDPGDLVRMEIERAVALDKRILPVLLGDAEMPPAASLPPSLAPLARRNAVRVSHERFAADAQALLRAVEGMLEDADTATRGAPERPPVEPEPRVPTAERGPRGQAAAHPAPPRARDPADPDAGWADARSSPSLFRVVPDWRRAATPSAAARSPTPRPRRR